MSIIFAKTRHVYDSYVDFWKLVELSGFETCYVDEIDPERLAIYIFTPHNGELEAVLERCAVRKCVLVWWFLERLDGTPILSDGTIDRMRERVDQIWVSDRWTASRHEAFRYVCLASHPGLGSEPEPALYEFTHQSYVWGRRTAIIDRLRSLGMREGPNAFGAERDQILRRSALMINVQQYDSPVYAPLRFALAAAYALPIVSETVRDPFPLDDRSIILAPYEGIVVTSVRALERSATLHEYGQALFEQLCVARTFRSEIEAAL